MQAQLSVPQPVEHEVDSSPRHVGSMKKLISFNNIRVQLLEQLCLSDAKLDTQSELIDELCDFFRHCSQLELEHSKGLDKVLHCFQASHNDQTAKNSKPWPSQTSYACWNHLINETKSISHDYAVLSEIYNADLIFKLQKILQTYKKYCELVFETHEEILRVLRNFHTTVKTYYIYLNEHKGVGTKSKSTDQRKRSVSPRKDKHQGTKSEKEMDVNTIEKLEVLKSRYIYKYYVDTANVAIHKIMIRDLKDIINSMDLGFGLMVSKAILSHVSTDQKQYLHKLYSNKSANSSTNDSESNTESSLVRKESISEKQPTEDKNIQNILDFELQLQMQLLRFREESLRKHQERIYGVLDVTGKNYHDKVKVVGEELEQELVTSSRSHSKAISVKHKEDGRLYILANLSPVAKQISFKSYTSHKMKVESRIHIQKPWFHRPKLFGGCLEDYLKATKEPIPLIMRSCIRVINAFGLQSQGIFRVSGSQVEILNFRDCFERGEDPLAGATDASDMNSVAGVLKLYLRELHEPLFPSKYFDVFLSLIEKESKYEVVIGMRNFLKIISTPTLIVMRYLFSFLNHLSENASENMMDAFNLAVSFGPTLMPAPSDKKQVQYQTQLNELIKVLIVYYKEVFPKDLGGPEYEKCMSEDTSR